LSEIIEDYFDPQFPLQVKIRRSVHSLSKAAADLEHVSLATYVEDALRQKLNLKGDGDISAKEAEAALANVVRHGKSLGLSMVDDEDRTFRS
jgi:hypothetical protein